ncbi:hypothetical protein LPA44_04135 [Halobacterium sp. KA-4]|uniref:hypothetical protein n=1 Tax=Halobacterium sp. KA-4 TaxID=2896367 RepID=UPI001E5B8E2D|nr:hypothetical protein [Halobacterium sp. KA-4]MCD2199088.1 hypothetical protein [Halobacterium sp. KA-4]
MAIEEATEAKLPFGMGSIDLFSTGGVLAVVAIILGATVWNFADAVGQTLANRVAQAFQAFTGYNPATGQDGDSGTGGV